MRQAIRTIQYLHCTRDLGLRFRTDHTHAAQTHTDSDWAGCPDTRQSTSGRVTMLQGAAVMWGSARQHSIALSSTEAEIIAACDAARDTRYLRRVHAALDIPITDPTPLMIDSSSALTWSAKRAKWSASRHVATRYFCIQQWRKDGHVLPTKVDTTRQLADICTKALPHATFAALRGMLMGRRFDADPIIHIDTLTQNLRAAPLAA